MALKMSETTQCFMNLAALLEEPKPISTVEYMTWCLADPLEYPPRATLITIQAVVVTDDLFDGSDFIDHDHDGPTTGQRRRRKLGSIKVNGDPRRNHLPLPICGIATSHDECSEPAAAKVSS